MEDLEDMLRDLLHQILLLQKTSEELTAVFVGTGGMKGTSKTQAETMIIDNQMFENFTSFCLIQNVSYPVNYGRGHLAKAVGVSSWTEQFSHSKGTRVFLSCFSLGCF